MAKVAAQPWPPANGLTTPTVTRNNAILTVTSSCRINAPAPLVFEILRDVANWGEWNTWVPRVTISSQSNQSSSESKSDILHAGTIMTFHSVMDSSNPEKVVEAVQKVTDISTPEHPSTYVSTETLEQDPSYTADLSKVYRISWKGQGSLDWIGLREERFQEIIPLGEKECELRSWENMGGFLARLIKWQYGEVIREKTEKWSVELKQYAERKAS